LNAPIPWPLPLSDFEYYMYCDDSPRYPMTFCLRAHLQGRLRKKDLEEALSVALERHPLFQARIQRTWRGYVWIPVTDRKIPLEWSDDPESQSPEPGWLDLSREPGLRVWVRTNGDRSTITVQYHHACCDGVGALQFLGDLLAHYGSLTSTENQPQPVLQELFPDLLLRRGQITDRSRRKPPPRRSLKGVFQKYKRYVSRRTMILAVPRGSRQAETRPSIMQTRVLERCLCRSLQEVANRQGVHLNDLCLLEMFLTLRDWNRQQEGLNPDEWLRIGMPINMRTPELAGLPACNMVSFMFLPRRPDDCDDERALLAGIREQTRRTLKERLGNWFLAIIRFARRVPGLLPLILKRRRPFATAILANVGEIERHLGAVFPEQDGKTVAGNVVVERIEGVAPVREATRMAVSLGIWSGELIVNMNCDPRWFSLRDAEQLLAIFIDRLRQRAETGNPSPQS
jgi:hypothetical protein